MASLDEGEPSIPEPMEPAVAGKKRKTPASASAALPPKPKKVYPKRAACWKHFIQREDDPSKCNCRYCGQELGCDSKLSGTSPMNNHIERCGLFKDFQDRDKQKGLASDSGGNMKFIKYDPIQFRRSVNEMVVVNELPFSFVESEGWKRFCFNILPLYNTLSRRTCTRDIVAIHLEEKVALKKLFSVEKKSVSLTTDIWVSPTTSYNYMVITAHWVDGDWKLQKRILSFKVITDHKGETIAGQLIDYLDEWGIEKVFTVTLDNAKANEKALRIFQDHLRMRGPESLVLGGELLHMRCCAHILNLILGDGLKESKASVVAIRNAFKYVRSSFTRLKSFALRCESGKVARGSLPLDCVTRWNSTYLMLTSGIKLRLAFDRMLSEDKLYCEYFLEEDEKTKAKRVGPPDSANWDEIQRNKLQFASLCFDQLYGKGTIERRLLYNSVTSVIKRLYDQYSIRLSKPLAITDTGEPEQPSSIDLSDDDDDGVERMDSIYQKIVSLRSNEDTCSELDIYLAEKTETRAENNLGMGLSVLLWWDKNSSKFPILSELARDVLALQVSSVASESAFSTSGRVLDPYRSSLTPHMVEVLLCTQQWLRCSYKSEAQVANLAQALADLEFMESLDSRNSIPSAQ